MIHQGDIYWTDFGDPMGSEPGYRHPLVVIQNDAVNSTKLNTVIVCALTSNLKRATAMGNVLLGPGEGNLPRQSVVNVSQLYTVDKIQLSEKIGTLSRARMCQIIAGINLFIEPREVPTQMSGRN